MVPEAIIELAAETLETCRHAGLKVATVESCTGGLVAAVLTEIAGSSDVVERGFVTYSNEAKTALVGVPAALIERVGAVSEEVARAMAEGGVSASPADLAVAITGVAGPGGGTEAKPVGLVHFACARRGTDTDTVHERHVFAGDRRAVRLAAVETALHLIRACAGE